MTTPTPKADRFTNRAPRGGAISPVNSRFYAGGTFMPMVAEVVEVRPAPLSGSTRRVLWGARLRPFKGRRRTKEHPVPIIDAPPVAVHARLAVADRLGLDDEHDEEDDYRASTSDGECDPTPDGDAWWAGSSLALDGDMLDAAAPVAPWNVVERANFRVGQSFGLIERHRIEDMEREAQLLRDGREEWAIGDPMDKVPHAELAGVCGIGAIGRRGSDEA